MDDHSNHTAYRLPERFNPYIAMDTLRGLTDALHYLLIEGYGSEARMHRGHKAALDSLAELLQKQVHALHEYLMELENRTTLDLPTTEAEFDALDVRHARKDEVRQPAPLYSVN